jgi:hypothetical protein
MPEPDPRKRTALMKLKAALAALIVVAAVAGPAVVRPRPEPPLPRPLFSSTAAAPFADVGLPVARPTAAGARDTVPDERAYFMNAARVAWRYVEQQSNAQTGLVNSVVGYPYTTVWDIGSTLGALYSADQLDLISGDEYDRRLRKLLGTLRTMPLFADAAFNKNYSTERATMVDRDNRDTQRGTSVTVTDMGRLLIWLKIIAVTQPQYAQQVQAVVDRFDLRRFIRDGYMFGEAYDRSGRLQRYQEGRLGYEQYAAAGFELWGSPAQASLDLAHNAQAVSVLGIPILADRRRGEFLASEPFVLAGLELGWYPELRNQAWRMLAAQEARFRQTGQVTIASEDAINQAPYFLYYSVFTDGRPFVVTGPEGQSSGGNLPRTRRRAEAIARHGGWTWAGDATVSRALPRARTAPPTW